MTHSLSPVLHAAAYAHLGLDWSYTAHDVGADELAGFVDGLDGSWRGLSLTMPLKRAALPLCDEVSPLARTIEAVNTLLLEPGGGRLGDTTDVPGLVAALRERGIHRVGRAAVLGGGATAACAVAALHLLGARTEVFVRSPGRADELDRVAAALGAAITISRWERLDDCVESDLVVATTPAGATDPLAERLSGNLPRYGRSLPGLFDVVYEPWPTRLAEVWGRAAPVLGGLDLLVHQATLQVALMTGRPVPVEVLRRAGEDALAARAAAARR